MGKAYVNDNEWDISSLQACQPGSTCPVSSTYTDQHFMVPQGCAAVDVQVIKSNNGKIAARLSPRWGMRSSENLSSCGQGMSTAWTSRASRRSAPTAGGASSC